MRFRVERTSLTDLSSSEKEASRASVCTDDSSEVSNKGKENNNEPECVQLGGPSDSPTDETGLLSEEGKDKEYKTISTTSFDSKIFEPVARRGQFYANRQRTRLIQKSGEINIYQSNVKSRGLKFIIDIFTTMVDLKWRYNILMFSLGFLCTWIGFALLWWIILRIRGDHNHVDDPDWTPCMSEVYDFTTAVLFSLETQHTIGYGSRSMMPKCPEAIILLMVQSGVGVFVQSLMTGIIFAKLARPKRRAQTVLFSKNAVICIRDGVFCLLFRVGDMRKSQIIGTSVRAIMVKNRVTKEGETIPFCQYPLAVHTESSLEDSYAFLATPVTVMHTIDEKSPLWSISADELLAEHFEIIVLVEGTSESTGQSVQFRTSYLPAEIQWGSRLKPLLTYHKDNGQYKIDYGLFHNTEPILDMPECSAKDMCEKKLWKPGQKQIEIPMNFTAPLRSSQRAGPSKPLLRRLWSLKAKKSTEDPIKNLQSYNNLTPNGDVKKCGAGERSLPRPGSDTQLSSTYATLPAFYRNTDNLKTLKEVDHGPHRDSL